MPSIRTPLIEFALRGLERCYMANSGLWSHAYRLDGVGEPNVSVPQSDVFYSLNVLLGCARVADTAVIMGRDRRQLYVDACRRLNANARVYAWGMALWAGAELGCDVPAETLKGARDLLGRMDGDSERWRAQDLGLMLSGVVARAKIDAAWTPAARKLASLILDRLRGPRDLFFDALSGTRREFASFASQVYAVLGLYHYGEWRRDEAALGAADACVRKLLTLQGARGEWPWFYHAPTGRVVDFYEIYSVHQHGMGPAILHHAVARNIPGARAALVKGFGWIFGANEMGRTMLRPELQLIHRSQRRAGWRGDRRARIVRASLNAALGRSDHLENQGGKGLELTQEVRSYEIGWILWSFGGRIDYPELTDRPEFKV
jgi:hypothetical protein